MRGLYLSVAALTVVVAFSTSASATSSECSYSSGSYYGNCGGNVTTSSEKGATETLTRSSTVTLVNTVSNRVVSALAGVTPRQTADAGALGTGLSAGDGGSALAVWGSLGVSSIDGSEPGYENDGTVAVGTLGADYTLGGNSVVGVTLFRDSADVKTLFNAGQQDSTGLSLVPYVGYSFGQGTTIDALAGYTMTTNDVARASGNARGEFDGYRLTGAVNLHHSLYFDAWSLRGDLGYSYAYASNDGYTETGAASRGNIGKSTSHLGQGKIGGRVGYLVDKVEPYASVHYLYDFVSDDLGNAGAGKPKNDDDEVLLTLGADLLATDSLVVGAEVSKSFFRENDKNTTVLATGRISF